MAKELAMLSKTEKGKMARLSLSDSGKITMLQKYGANKGLPTDFAP